MALLSSFPAPPPPLHSSSLQNCSLYNNLNFINVRPFQFHSQRLPLVTTASSSHVCSQPESPRLDKSSLLVAETTSEEQLWAASCLRVRSFYRFQSETYGVQDHKKYLAEREFEALKERIAGKRAGFGRVSCINATLPLGKLSDAASDLCTECKFTENGEDRVVVGTLDINQCIKLPDEITGQKPEGIGADFSRAYLSNVCVASELLRKGLAYELIEKSKMVAQEWGISDMYVHVAIDNEPAKKLYMKTGFTFENDEPAWQARFLDRPRRILLWIGIPLVYQLFITNITPDEEDVKIVMQMAEEAVHAQERDPYTAFANRVKELNYGNSYFFKPIKISDLQKVDPLKACDYFNFCFKDPSTFTVVIVGNIDPSIAIPLILQYLGGIPKPPEPIFHFNRDDLKGLPFTFPTKIVREVICSHMVEAQCSVQLCFPVELKNGTMVEEIHRVGFLSKLIETKIMQVLCFKHGQIYSVGVSVFLGGNKPSSTGDVRGDISVNFSCDPEISSKLLDIALDEILRLQD